MREEDIIKIIKRSFINDMETKIIEKRYKFKINLLFVNFTHKIKYIPNYGYWIYNLQNIAIMGSNCPLIMLKNMAFTF